MNPAEENNNSFGGTVPAPEVPVQPVQETPEVSPVQEIPTTPVENPVEVPAEPVVEAPAFEAPAVEPTPVVEPIVPAPEVIIAEEPTVETAPETSEAPAAPVAEATEVPATEEPEMPLTPEGEAMAELNNSVPSEDVSNISTAATPEVKKWSTGKIVSVVIIAVLLVGIIITSAILIRPLLFPDNNKKDDTPAVVTPPADPFGDQLAQIRDDNPGITILDLREKGLEILDAEKKFDLDLGAVIAGVPANKPVPLPDGTITASDTAFIAVNVKVTNNSTVFSFPFSTLSIVPTGSTEAPVQPLADTELISEFVRTYRIVQLTDVASGVEADPGWVFFGVPAAWEGLELSLNYTRAATADLDAKVITVDLN
jgi:hypothetical protein